MQKSRWNSLLLAVILAPVWFTAGQAKAQEETAKKTEGKEAAAPEQRKPKISVCRLDYKVYELENGKRTNSRSYTMFTKSLRDRVRLRTGNRVPIRTAFTDPNNIAASVPVQYQDVGLNIDSSVDEQGEKLLVTTTLDISSIAPNETAGSSVSTSTGSTFRYLDNPVFRTLRLEDATLATPGKPALVGAIDDVTSNHRYEIEVTVTKID